MLVVAGDVTADEVKALAEATYGKVAPRSEIGARQRPQEPTQVASRHVTLSDPRVEQPSLQRSYLVPSSATAKPGEAEALEVLSQILGGGTTGRLYRALVIERQVALNAGAWYQGSGLDATRFGVYGSPKPGTTLPQLEEAIDAVIAELLAKGITADELERVKSRLIADAVFARDSQATLARWYGVALTTGSTVEEVSAWPDRMRAVTADAVVAAAKTWLDKRRSVTGYLIKDNPKTRGKALVIRHLPFARAVAALLFATLVWRRSGGRDQHRTGDLARRHRGVAGAGACGADDRAAFLRSRAAPIRIPRSSRASATWRLPCSTTAPANWTRKRSSGGCRSTPSRCGLRSRATICRARCGCCAIAKTRASNCCGWR